MMTPVRSLASKLHLGHTSYIREDPLLLWAGDTCAGESG